MREDRALRSEGTRSSALWGRGSKGESRSSALWGRRGGRSAAVFASLVVVLALPVAGLADNGASASSNAVVPADLLAAAQANPDQQFNVIVQGDKAVSSHGVANAVSSSSGVSKREFSSVTGVSATISGKTLVKLARFPHITAITPDVRVKTADYQNAEMWRDTVDISSLWPASTSTLTGTLSTVTGPATPAIAIVDSGIDATKVGDFGSRIVANVNLSSLTPLASGDDEGHGTMVADIAAGSNPLHRGVAPTAPIVSLRTADANGQSMTSDVIAACDWILANKAKYNIRVANFSMAGSTNVSFRNDPLDKAVEKLWFNGVTVVAAAGNFGTGSAVDMSKAPGNDPFVITVGAVDQNQTADPLDDTVPSWSAYGFTMDGFSKPDMVAPGRYMIAAVPANASIPATVPDRVTAPGYMWMSGTSFAAPVVAGSAAQILALNPSWTPDQVKGALMLTSNYLPVSNPQSVGVGEVDGAAAASLGFTPPNPNENLDAFVSTSPTTGQPVFNDANWASAVASNASWSSANWASASWASASWSSANWTSASWSSANWATASTQAIMSQVNWSEANWTEATYAP
jgi:serine protease AprX